MSKTRFSKMCFGRNLMSNRLRISLGSIISTAAVATFLAVSFMPATANATLRRRPAPSGSVVAAGPNTSTFNVGYFDVAEPALDNGTGVGDNIVHLINPTAANGTLCAMIYVFDDDEEPGECCGCPLSPNKLLTLSVRNQLTANWEVNGNDFDNGVIKIVSAVPNGGTSPAALAGCDPSIPYVQTPDLVGTIVKPQTISNDVTVTSLTENNMFEEGAPDVTEAALLINECAFFVAHGTGKGLCNCGPEELP
jgi:hypothetical protein